MIDVPKDLDPACLSLFKAMNQLPGIETTESCCGHGKSEFHMWFRMYTNQLGSDVMTRCMSGRYCCYAPGELRADPQWRVYLADTDHGTLFLLEGKPMAADGPTHEPAELLAANIQEHIDEDFERLMSCREHGEEEISAVARRADSEIQRMYAKELLEDVPPGAIPFDEHIQYRREKIRKFVESDLSEEDDAFFENELKLLNRLDQRLKSYSSCEAKEGTDEA